MSCPNVRSISGLLLEREILSQLNEFLDKFNNPDSIQIQDNTQEQIARYKLELNNVSRQIADKQSWAERLYEDKLDGIISNNQKNADEIVQLQQKQEMLETQIEQCENQKSPVDIKQIVEKYSHIEVLTKEVADEFIKVVYVGEYIEGQKREITIEWNF